MINKELRFSLVVQNKKGDVLCREELELEDIPGDLIKSSISKNVSSAMTITSYLVTEMVHRSIYPGIIDNILRKLLIGEKS